MCVLIRFYIVKQLTRVTRTHAHTHTQIQSVEGKIYVWKLSEIYIMCMRFFFQHYEIRRKSKH